MSIVQRRKIFYIFSGLLFVAALLSLAIYGMNFGSDFTGDARFDLVYSDSRPEEADIRQILESANIKVLAITLDGDLGYLIRTPNLTEDDHQRALLALRTKGALTEKTFVSTGPTVGTQLRRNAIIAIAVAIFAIVAYITFAFRKVSRPIASWIYGVIAIVALLHDVIIPTGLFSFFEIEIDSLFVSALLTVLGFSIHDTIVVFDRIRENLRKSTRLADGRAGDFEEIVGRSLKETITRSINTSLTTVLALLAVYFFGGATTKNFALALISGIIVGTYSSIFIASPLLVTVERWKRK